jgi:hypothetical protein
MCVTIDIDVKTLAVVCSSLFAAVGLLLNFRVTRRNNRIAVSTKLAELSRLISYDLIARVQMHRLLVKELEEAKAHPDQTIAAGKIDSLEKSLSQSRSRQSELDAETDYLDEAFMTLDKVDVGRLDAKIAQSYRAQRLAESILDYAKEKKEKRDA